MNPGRYNITLVQGTTFQLAPQWLVNNAPVNLTGYTASMQVRQFVDSTTLLTEANTSNGKIVITPATGTITITLPASETTSYPANNYTYALNLTTPDNFVYQILNGSFIVQASAVH